jgi:N-acetylglucosamine repressor
MKDVSTKRERDKSVLLDLVRRFGPISRVGIHDITQLRPGTISTLVRELLRERTLVEAGTSDNPMGRKQVLLRLNENLGSVAAVEFDAESVVAAVFSLGARMKQVVVEPTDLEHGIDGVVDQLLRCMDTAIAKAGVDRRALVGVGVADPGLIDSRQGISLASSTIEFWHSVPLQKIFEKHFGIPLLLESKTRARTVAERMQGAGEMAEDMIYVDYGTGIGMGVISEGKLLRGRGECAGEFGHTHVMEGGPPCRCGSFGCLEAIVGAPAIAAQARSAVMKGGNSAVLELAGGDAAGITAWHVIEAARGGDKMCAVILEEVERYLGLGLANVVNLLNPSLVILDRRMAAGDAAFLKQTARIVRRQALEQSTCDLQFRYSQLGAEAGVLGVALLVIERHFEIPTLKLPVFMTEPSKARPRKFGRVATA